MDVRSNVGDLAKCELPRSQVVPSHPDIERRVIQNRATSRRGINDPGAIRQPGKPAKLVSVLSHLARLATGTRYSKDVVLENLASLKSDPLIIRRPYRRRVFRVRRKLGKRLIARPRPRRYVKMHPVRH